MAKDILKEAIADAKAVREVALANAKAALEEAFTPKLQSMLSAKLSEDLDEGKDEEENLEETYMDEDEDMKETYMDETDDMENMDEVKDEEMEENLDEVVDLEEILNELELEEAKADDEKVDEAKDTDDKDSMEEAKKDDDDKKMEEAKDKDDKDSMEEAKDDKEDKLDENRPIYKAEDANYAGYSADRVHEDKEFDLDALLEEINNLDETEETDEAKKDDMDEMGYGMEEAKEDDVDEIFNLKPGQSSGVAKEYTTLKNLAKASSDLQDFLKKAQEAGLGRMINNNWINFARDIIAGNMKVSEVDMDEVQTELDETKKALETVRTELTEVNLLNSKLLYVNRIFKANTLDEAQKLRVVETLDKAESAKEAKLIYETIKDTFNVAKSKKASNKSKTRTLKEGLGMASKAAGTSTAPKKGVIAESNDMVSRFQKLANIKISE